MSLVYAELVIEKELDDMCRALRGSFASCILQHSRTRLPHRLAHVALMSDMSRTEKGIKC